MILTDHQQTNLVMLGQNYHEKILRSHLEKMGTVVEFGSELRGFEQFEDHVTVRIVRHSDGEESVEETQVPWLVGTDGAHSIVRKTLAIPFLGETREAIEMVVGDIKVKAGLDDHEVWNCEFILQRALILFLCRFWRDGSHPQCKVFCCVFNSYLSLNRVMLRPSGQDEDVFNIMMGGPDVDSNKIISDREELLKSFYSITKRTDILFGDLIWISKYRLERTLLFIYLR